MRPYVPKPREGPEAAVQRKVINRLKMNDWFAKETHGSEYQSGFPDVFACHRNLGARWIECKLPTGSRIEPSQNKTFQEFGRRDVGVWILTSAEDWEYNKLFLPPNWHHYLEVMKSKSRYAKPTKPKEDRKQPDGPERQIQEECKGLLEAQGWYVKDTFGSIYQYGFPDQYACHKLYGCRWIEYKNPAGFSFTPAQIKTFPLMTAHGTGIWIIKGKEELPKLFEPHNFWHYLAVMR